MGTTLDQARPSTMAGKATARPASGPAAAMSKSELRSLAGERIRMMAPSVPKGTPIGRPNSRYPRIGGGAGTKYGRLTEAPW